MKFQILIIACVASAPARGAEKPLPQPWEYAPAMKKVAARADARPGVVLHLGDSITYANPYGQWARAGQGQTAEDRKALAWMHAGADDDSDGWYLARVDLPEGRSYTACGGLRADELLAGGKNGMPPLEDLLDRYRPQAAVLMIGTNDASAGRPVAAYRADVEKAVGLMLDRGIVCILSTIPPHPGRPELAKSYNEALRALARSHSLPLIDYEREILTRRPDDWNGTLLGKNDVHPTAEHGKGEAKVTSASAPTAENLRNCGYLLRGWLSVEKIAEVKRTVFDALPAARPAAAPAPSAPKGQEVRLPVTRDTWLSEFGPEAEGGNGGSARLKLKSYQEMSLVDIDAKSLRGRAVRAATLHLRSAGEPRLKRVTVGTVGAEWVEGTATNYQPQKGSSSFHHRQNPNVPWSFPGSDLCSVILASGGTTWRMADASPPDAQGWQHVPVDPSVVAARVAGVSNGFLVFDDTGTEWTRQGEKFTLHHMPNRFVFSREQSNAAPYFTVVLGPEDTSPPEAPRELRTEPGDLPAGEAWVSWVTPPDRGPAGTVGFVASAGKTPVPHYLIPPAGKAGGRVRMHLRDLALPTGAPVVLSVRAVDGAGNVGPPAQAVLRTSNRSPKPLETAAPGPFTGRGPLPRLGTAEVAVIDELDKVHPTAGTMIPAQPAGYLRANHLWDAAARRVRLHAARNEFVAFQVLIGAGARGVRPALAFEGGAIPVEFGRYQAVTTRNGPLPDPIVPWAADDPAPVRGATSQSLHVELYIPHDAKAGAHRGKLTLTAAGATVALDVELTVWDFTLPDALSFLPEMNCYGLPDNERDYYRLAHRHRTVLNRVPYYHRGDVAEGCAPVRDGRGFDWSAWDKRFGPYFDGSAFADLPRRGVPIECFYLPIFENWPTPMEGNYNGDYWADRAFPRRYRDALVEVSRQFAEHFHEKKWDGTLFQFYLNGKNNFKEGGWSRGTSPWLLDEPANFQDFWALRYFGTAFHEGVNKTKGPAKLVFRCDISRPQWQRDALDGVLDYNVVGGALRSYHRLVMDRKAANGEITVEYGGSNPIEDANVQPVGWSLDAWSLGTDGVLPWQTVGTRESWERADPLALFYPGLGGGGPVPSVRLKAYRRGQQDVEYLTLLAQVTGEPRWAVGRRVREALKLAGQRQTRGGEDAGLVRYGRLLPQDLWALRVGVGESLSRARPAPRRQLVELRPPRRDLSDLAPGLVSTPGREGAR